MAKLAPTVPRVAGDVFLVLAYDAEGSAEIRDRDLDSHLEYVERNCDNYLICGPLRNPGEDALIGSFFLVAASSEADARDLVAGDPYVRSGMYDRIEVHSATPAAGRFLGGVIWESAEAVRSRAT